MPRLALGAAVAAVLVALALAALFILTPEKPPTPPAPTATPAETSQEHAAAEEDGLVVARVRTLDLQGRPLAGMLPIATRQPNAFDPPIAQGPPTGADGRGWVTFSGNESVCVRAWDPQRQLFANNYYDIPESPAGQTPEMDVVMVPAAAFGCVVLDRDGLPLAEVDVGLMMSHPTKGPWWPARATTSADGRIAFDRVPPGEYLITLRAEGRGAVDLGTTALRPGGFHNLGEARLR